MTKALKQQKLFSKIIHWLYNFSKKPGDSAAAIDKPG